VEVGFREATVDTHSLFESEPMTLAAWIWHERLEAGRRALISPTASRRSGTEIAYSIGFKYPAHFSRMFQATYVKSSREFRESLENAGAADEPPSR
jgi:transcriptional regulator GlxA family with amidase domain